MPSNSSGAVVKSPPVSRQHDLEIAIRLADLASDAALRWFRSPELGVEKKADGSVVTTADVEIEQMLRDELARICPKDAVLGEEFGATGEGPRVWTLDPIDGTGGFVAGNTEWATLIALVEEDVPVVGVVSRPARGTRWWASEGSGAFKDGQPVRVSETQRLAEAVLLEDFRVSVGRRLDTNPMTVLARASAGVRPWMDLYDLLPGGGWLGRCRLALARGFWSRSLFIGVHRHRGGWEMDRPP